MIAGIWFLLGVLFWPRMVIPSILPCLRECVCLLKFGEDWSAGSDDQGGNGADHIKPRGTALFDQPNLSLFYRQIFRMK